MGFRIKECTRDNLCVDCDDKACFFAGQAIADCPLYHCNRKGDKYEDCESCELLKWIHNDSMALEQINRFQEQVRALKTNGGETD